MCAPTPSTVTALASGPLHAGLLLPLVLGACTPAPSPATPGSASARGAAAAAEVARLAAEVEAGAQRVESACDQEAGRGRADGEDLARMRAEVDRLRALAAEIQARVDGLEEDARAAAADPPVEAPLPGGTP